VQDGSAIAVRLDADIGSEFDYMANEIEIAGLYALKYYSFAGFAPAIDVVVLWEALPQKLEQFEVTMRRRGDQALLDPFLPETFQFYHQFDDLTPASRGREVRRNQMTLIFKQHIRLIINQEFETVYCTKIRRKRNDRTPVSQNRSSLAESLNSSRKYQVDPIAFNDCGHNPLDIITAYPVEQSLQFHFRHSWVTVYCQAR
jgi:hypothetical protein